MGWTTRLPDGKIWEFPDEVTPDQVTRALLEQGAYGDVPSGFFNAVQAGIAGVTGRLGALPDLASAAITGDQEDYEAGVLALEEAERAERRHLPFPTSFQDVQEAWDEGGVGNILGTGVSYIEEQAGLSAPYLVPQFAATKLGIPLLSRFSKPIERLIGPAARPGTRMLTRYGLGASSMLPVYMADNMSRQVQAGAATAEDLSLLNATLAGAGQALAEQVFVMVMGGQGRALQRNAAQSIKDWLPRRLAEGLLEAPVEVVQQTLERLQAGESISPSDEGYMREVVEAAVGGATVGTVYAGGFSLNEARQRKRLQEAYKKAEPREKELRESELERAWQTQMGLDEQAARDQGQDALRRWQLGFREAQDTGDLEKQAAYERLEADIETTKEDVIAAAQARNIKVDDDGFRAFTSRTLTHLDEDGEVIQGKRHLDDLDAQETHLLYNTLTAMPVRYGAARVEQSLPMFSDEQYQRALEYHRPKRKKAKKKKGEAGEETLQSRTVTPASIRESLGPAFHTGSDKFNDRIAKKILNRMKSRRDVVPRKGGFVFKHKVYTEEQYSKMLNDAIDKGQLTTAIIERTLARTNPRIINEVKNDMLARDDVSKLNNRYIPKLNREGELIGAVEVDEFDGWLIRDPVDQSIIGGARNRNEARKKRDKARDESNRWDLFVDGELHQTYATKYAEKSATTALRRIRERNPGVKAFVKRRVGVVSPVAEKVYSVFERTRGPSGQEGKRDNEYFASRDMAEEAKGKLVAGLAGLNPRQDRVEQAMVTEAARIDKDADRRRLEAEPTQSEVDRRETVLSLLEDSLSAVGLNDIRIALVDSMSETNAEGSYDLNRIINLAIDKVDPNLSYEEQARELGRFMDHELMHGLVNLDLLTEEEMSMMANYGMRTMDPNHPNMSLVKVQEALYAELVKRTGDESRFLTRQGYLEEGMAQGYRYYNAAKDKDPDAPVAVMEKINMFFDRLGNHLAGYGFRSAEDVFDAIRAGAVGLRDRGVVRNLRLAREINDNLVETADASMRADKGEPLTPDEVDSLSDKDLEKYSLDPSSIQPWQWMIPPWESKQDDGGEIVSARFNVDIPGRSEPKSVVVDVEHYPTQAKGSWEVGFTATNEDGILTTRLDKGAGAQATREVFATVLDILGEFVDSKVKSGEKPVSLEIDGSGRSRVRYYSTVLRRYAPRMGYEISKNLTRISDDGTRGRWVLLDKDIKSALKTKFSLDPSGLRGGDLYSPLALALSESKERSLTLPQLKAYLRDEGVKKDEVEWSGLDAIYQEMALQEWLSRNPGTRPPGPVDSSTVKINLDDLEGMVSPFLLDEVVLGGGDLSGVGNRAERAEYLRRAIRGIERDFPSPDARPWEPPDGGYPSDYYDLVEELRVLEEVPLPTRHESYTLPGGENYQETLITLPGDVSVEGKTAAEWDKEAVGWLNSGMVDPEANASWKRAIANRNLAREKAAAHFTGGHYGSVAPNVLVHVRHNDRTGPNGERVLFIEEIQDDWAKAGRKKGYALPEERIRYLEARREELERIGGASLESDKELLDQLGIDTSGNRVVPAEVRQEWVEVMNELQPESRHSRVPDRPFKTTSHEMALKRMIAKAIREGYDSVAWTPGIIQVNRYESALRKVVDSIGWQRGGVSWVSGDTHSQSEIVVDARKDNSSVLEMVVDANSGIVIMGSDTDVVDSPLEDVVGKSIAEQILEGDQSGIVEGDNLTIGGQGFIDVYDGKLVQEANRFGKKYGAKVEMGGVDVGESIFKFGPNQWNISSIAESFKTKAEAVRAAQEQVHTFKLTPAMSAEAEASGTRMYSLSADQLKILEKTNRLTEEIPGLAGLLPYLTDMQKAKLRSDTTERLVKVFADIPEATELASVSFAGREKRGWYADSAKAILDIFGAEDAPRFAALLAALSPRKSVEGDAKNSLNVWVNWVKAGRPTSRKEIIEIMGMSVEGEFHGDPIRGQKSVMNVWRNNTVRALTAEDPVATVLSGPKANSFMLNLRGFVNEVTNDTWMANLLGVQQKLFEGEINVAGTDPGKTPGYMAVAALTRKAAKILSNRTGEDWTPHEVQETAWSWARSLVEQRRSKEEVLDAIQLVRKQGGPDIERLSETPDFAILFTTGVYKEIIEKGGLTDRADIAARNRKAARSARRRRGWNKTSDPGIAERSFNADLGRAAKRLEAYATDRYGPKKPRAKLSLAFTEDATGDVVTGDTIEFSEAVWGGSRRSPKKVGDRTIRANVIKDSYGTDKQQHTFSLEVISSEGTEPISAGKRILRKGRNVYRNGTMRQLWDNESSRDSALEEKHLRGGIAREERDIRTKLSISPSNITDPSSYFYRKVRGEPVEFRFIRNTERAEDFGGTFGQDIEPAGRYLNEASESVIDRLPEESPFESGEITFKNPLYIEWGDGYNSPSNWKNVLSDEFNATGEELSRLVASTGHDGIVVIDENGFTSEIVDLTMFAQDPADEVIETVQQMDPNMNDNGTIRWINENATERNKQIARGEIEGEKLSENQKKKYSLASGQPDFAGDIPNIIRRAVTIRRDQTLFEKISYFMDKENRPEFWNWLRQRALNQYERAGWMDRELAQKTGNNVYLMAAVASMSSALNSDKARGMFTYGLEKGIPVLKKTMAGDVEASWATMAPFEITMPDGSKRQGGLRTILTPLFANNSNLYPLWSSFMIARREHRFEAMGKEVRMNAESRQKIFDLVGYNPETKTWTNSKYPNLEVVDKNYQAWNSAFVDFLVASGVFTPSEAEIYKSYADYIPFYRQWDGESNAELDANISGLIEEEDKIRGVPRKARPPSMFHSMTGAQGARPAKGGEAKIDDPLENILQNAFAGLQAGMKNLASQKVIRNAELLGLATPTDNAGDSTHTIRIDGIDKHFTVKDALVVEVLSGVMDARMPWLDLLSKPARWLRELITRSPDFLAANLLRDTGSAWVTSGADFTPFTGALKNMFSGDADPRWEALERAGVASGFENMNNPEDFRKYVEKQWKREGVSGDANSAWKFFDKIWTASGKLSTRSDMSVRMEVWQDVVSRMEAEGKHDRSVIEAEADFQASETLNFGRRGSSPYYRILTALVPFTGARFQGLDVLYRAGAGKYGTDYNAVQSGAALMRFRQRAMMVLSLAGMYWLLVHDDDDYLGQTDETRDMNLIIPSSILPGDSPLKFPKPFEVGFLLITVPEAILSWFNDDIDNRDAINTLKRGMIATLHFNPMPQAAKPMYEVFSNYSSWTGRNVVPEHQLDLKPHLQYTDATGEFARLLGKTFGASPLKIEHVIRGYTGTLGSYGLFLVDEATRSMSDLPSRPPLELSDFPMFRRFIGKPGGQTRGDLQKFYDLREASDLAFNSWRKLRREGRHGEAKDLRRESKEIFETRGRVLGMDRRVSAIRGRMRRVMLSDIPAEEKAKKIESARKDLERALSDLKKIRMKSDLPIDTRIFS